MEDQVVRVTGVVLVRSFRVFRLFVCRVVSITSDKEEQRGACGGHQTP